MFVLNIRKPLAGFLYLLYITVTPVEDGDSQFECGGNHGSRFTCNKMIPQRYVTGFDPPMKPKHRDHLCHKITCF